MKCGYCKREDAGVTIAHVRGCDGRQQLGPEEDGPFRSNKLNEIHAGLKRGETHPLATSLLDKRPPNRRARRDATNADVRRAAEAVPPGRYGLRNADGEWRFYQIDKPEEGRWAGYTFINHLASEETYPVKGIEQRLMILLGIGVDPEEAAKAYGRETRHCSQCHRLLTNPRSIAAGIGPDCAGNLGWSY